jgi:hypothetical protein
MSADAMRDQATWSTKLADVCGQMPLGRITTNLDIPKMSRTVPFSLG